MRIILGSSYIPSIPLLQGGGSSSGLGLVLTKLPPTPLILDVALLWFRV